MRFLSAATKTLIALLVLAPILSASHPVNTAPRFSPKVQQPAKSEKESRTPEQRKIDSQLLSEIYRARGQAAQKKVPPGKTGVKIDAKGRAFVDVRSEVTPELRKKVGLLGGTIVSTSVEYRSIVAWVPLLMLERLAEDRGVYSIQPVAEATTNQQLPK